MVSTISSPSHQNLNTDLDYGFLLLVHVICADEQLHILETEALQELAERAEINSVTHQAMEAILGSDEYISVDEVITSVPTVLRWETLQQVVAIAYIDGFFAPQERHLFNQIIQKWQLDAKAVQELLLKAQPDLRSQGSQRTLGSQRSDQSLSMPARFLKGAETLLSRALVEQLTELAPKAIAHKIETIQREILLAGPEYDEAIQRCAKVASEDFKYAQRSLVGSYQTLKELGHSLGKDIDEIAQAHEQQTSAQEVAMLLQKTRQELNHRILKSMETVQREFKAKERSLSHFSIAFMGKTKVGKSTLHAVITKQGWDGIGVGKQRTTRHNQVYEWKNIRIIDTTRQESGHPEVKPMRRLPAG
ncbi:MAG: GTPase [Cyanobacteria bacterium P01_F01_bin.150]